MREWFQKHLFHAELNPAERRAVLEDLFVFGKENQKPFLVRMTVLLVLSTIIATAGLLSDSAAVVIGAMLVAPMMNPVMAAAGSVVMGWPQRFYNAVWLVLAMGLGAVFLSSLIALISPEVVFIPEQVLARTRPTYYDLLIALAAGSAGAYTITHKESGAIPGVAVAVALLPPLASSGILLVSGEMELATRAVVLFLTNLIAMILAGALTFMACGVSPAQARARSAAFIKNKLWLFALLMAAICIPLFFYSEKVIFNADYRAAKSVTLQNWLRENRLELVDVDMQRENRILYLGLQGPNPPVNIKTLYENLLREANVPPEAQFTLQYSWNQKVDGSWPILSNEIGEVAQSDQDMRQALLQSTWAWDFSQYDAQRGSRPPDGDRYLLTFAEKDTVKVIANCGTKKGKYSLRGKSIFIEMKRLNWFNCRDDDDLQVFFGDLQRATEFYIENGDLRISLPTDSGLMYFRKQ